MGKVDEADWSDPPFFAILADGRPCWTGIHTTADIRREMLRCCPKQPCACDRCVALKRELAARCRARVNYWALILGPLLVAALAAVGLVFGCYTKGREDAIKRYRDECNAAGSSPEVPFTLLYVDEYTYSNCEESIRHVWGEDAVRPNPEWQVPRK